MWQTKKWRVFQEHDGYYVYWFIIGIVAGIIAGKLVNRHGEGLLLDLVIGVVGAFISGWLFAKLGFHIAGLLGSLINATAGAIVLLLVVRLFRR